ncbi:MAG: hypothetical protein ACOX7R_11060 [Acetivibrionales bacterium]|jgi:hypothetical protein
MMKKTAIILVILLIAASTGVYASSIRPYGEGQIEGYLISIDDTTIQIEEYDGTIHTFSYGNKSTVFMIDRRLTNRIDFKPGMEVFAYYRNLHITNIEGFSTINSGYIAPGERVRTGTVQSIDRNQIILKLPAGKIESYFTSPATIVTKNGVNVPLSTLYEGDRVRLFFDEIDTSVISRIQIEGNSIIIKGLYKGELATAGIYDNSVTLTGVELYKNGQWHKYKSSATFKYTDDVAAYIGGTKVLRNYLKYYMGKTLYLAVSDYFGNDMVERMVFKNQYESTYNEKIKSINWYGGAIELSNKKNLTFNEGTIIVKNGRLVDEYAIHSEADAFIAADGKGNGGAANVIYIYNENINNSNVGEYYIYAARLDEIVEGKVVMEDFFLLENNEWVSFDEEKELYYDDDTYIYNLEEEKAITPEEFYSENYAVDEDSDYADDNRLKDWYGYIFTDGDRIAGIALQKNLDSLSGQRVTNGTIESTTENAATGWTMRLMNAADWSRAKEKWMEKSSSTSINVQRALIMKDGRMVSQDALKTGDRLFIIRDGYYAKIVIIK